MSNDIVEKPYRSILKTLSWRLTGTIDTMVISFLITGSFKFAFSIGMVEVFTKMILYYFHERLWSRLQIGRVVKESRRPPEYQI